MTELPIVVINVQRGGPSTGLPTKTEQADLLQAMYGRNGEAPVVVVAASTPSDCFNMAIESSRLALQHMTPVILLTDGYIANGTEPWKIPDPSELKKIEVKYADDPENFKPYARDENLVRPWAPAGTPGFEHRIGGLEKENITGDVSYDPQNHHDMCRIREEKIKKIANEIPELEVMGDKDADILVAGWGGTYGAITDAVTDLREKGYKVAQVHFKYINPMPKNTEEVLKNYKHVLVPEINFGQLAMILKSEYLIPVHQFNLVRGLPFKSTEIEDKVIEILGGKND
jgi:2-oxoglutarate ferredoxin oxidoreductase subunit alpha